MLQKVLLFIKYNNAFTLIFVIFFFGVSATFAASPTVREGVYGSEETVVSINNKAIISADFDHFDFSLKVDAITEDSKNYFVVYSYRTLLLEDGAWQNKSIEKTLTVSKESLDGKDLGLYVAKQLGENMNYELSYLQRVQKLEREKGESEKIVAIEYSGLIGKLLNPKEQVIEGYDPVILEPEPQLAVPETPAAQEAAIIESIDEIQKNPKPVENPVVPVPPSGDSSSGGSATSSTTPDTASTTPDNTSSQASTTPTVEATDPQASTTPSQVEIAPTSPEATTTEVAPPDPTPPPVETQTPPVVETPAPAPAEANPTP